MESTFAVSMQDLPTEIIEIIASYLSSDDLDACFRVCRGWKSVFNLNRIWRKYCVYPEKYFKASGSTLGSRGNKDYEEVCFWKKSYDRQKLLWDNWSKGRFTKKKTDMCLSMLSYLVYFVDNFGNYWLLYSNYDDGISVWKIDEIPDFHCKLDEKDQFGIVPIKNKLLTHISDYIQIFEFKPPENELVLQYRFKFNEDTILPKDNVFINEYVSSQRFIIVDNFLIGYCESITDLLHTYVHIWDCDSGEKVATQSIFQHSFVDYMSSSTGIVITTDFEGSLLLFDSDSRRFLVSTTSHRYKLCEISLFSLDEMKFVNVVARIESGDIWCIMKGDTVAIYHSVCSYNRLSQLSVYNTNGKFLAKLDIAHAYNHYIYREFWLTLSRVILKVRNTIYVLDITDLENIRARSFDTNTNTLTLGYVEPKFLLLYDMLDPFDFSQKECALVSIWDVDSGSKLWNLGHLDKIDSCRFLFSESVYPNKVIVHFTGEKEVSLLDFECE
ncbi:uncharacterized protein LOC124357886 [Homalodisca vitripennis]|uniref:uncharacterized protein LOC124357886 n=1 Tax=Homalodisca vitripennis TaxID=197043 RepID=UPI001EEBCA51|nr:uncharacterized protein LOC124357886 [Homalodisca vitripennis]